MRMLQGSRVRSKLLWRDEVNADGGKRYVIHANRYAEEALWRSESEQGLAEEGR